MKNPFNKPILGLFFLSLLSGHIFAQIEKRKTITKTYPYGKQPLEIYNQYGKIHVNTDNQTNISVNVSIWVTAGTEAEAQKSLDAITIDIDEGSLINPFSPIVFSTDIGKMTSYGKNKYEINYTLNIPKQLGLTLQNKYGDIYLAEHTGPLAVNIKYGNLKTDYISGSSEKWVTAEYSNAIMGYMEQGYLVLKYSDCQFEGGDDIDLTNEYSRVDIGKINNLALKSKYGKVAIESVENITGSSAYSDFNLASLSKLMEMLVNYNGSFNVKKISDGFSKINLESNFTNCNLQFNESACFGFDVKLEYADLNTSSCQRAVLQESNNSPNAKSYKGKFCSAPSPISKVYIRSKYGNIVLK